ncbi:flocculation protein FLO11-like isoform X2 [Leguminivora glycinivorella]|uniref:flocculation protein FLO11-like isoform X2 n=1 Tax=Leguminivora glycinivorella TaxID=1035111 RepID=UPI00200F2155|nr:flocculation protein FLO11-like isoform X2 [Leguminivora glycinivorella]
MLLAIIVCAEIFQVYAARFNYTDRSIKAIDPLDPGGCYHEGRWHAGGAPVRTRAACLRCTCTRGVLACARRACAPLPDPPPRCHVLHRKGACCPELHCPDGVKLMELGASARFEDEDFSETSSIASVGHACVEGGSVFGAGSALAPGVACEQCFCLGGARRCVRPTCLPPPRGCVARPAPGACCPQRYYCSHEPPAHGTHDCKAEDTWYKEGERILSAERACTQCFCLRGTVRCQPLSCAPPLLGCKPLLRPGECCPHQYHCEHADKSHPLLSSNSLISVRNDDRSFHTSESNKIETSTKVISTTTKAVSTSISSTTRSKTDSPTTLATEKAPVNTSKVKRKTEELHATITNNSTQNITSTTELPSTTSVSTTERLVRSNFETSTMDLPEPEDLDDLEDLPSTTSTEQPEGSVRIVINGTINCTAELSSTSLPLNLTVNDTERIKMEAQPRIPILTTGNIESHTFNPNDIITDRSVNGEFDDNEMFTINVTSSLSTNSSRVTSGPSISTLSKIAVPTDLPSVSNMSKKTNEFDFDYAEPTLPPSLPNLKIIPFVAADAVVDEESPKEVLTYPILEREDKYPVYYPTLEAKDTPFATRREDIYHPTQYPVFTSEKVDTSQYPVLSHEVDITSSDYPTANNNLLHELSASLGSHISETNKAVTKIPSTSTTFKLETPSINLFSPPVETEGGFIPKGPGIIDEYYAVYPSTPSAPSVPHLTTSMQLDTAKDCLMADGHRVPEGTTMDLMCSVCSCTWGKIHCGPRACLAPDGCYYNPELHSSTSDVCCGELVCVEEKETTTSTNTTTTTEKIFVKPIENTNFSTNKSVDQIKTENKTVEETKFVPKLEIENSTKVAITVLNETSKTDKHNKSTTPVTLNTSTSSETVFTSPTTSTSAPENHPEHEANQTHFPSQDYEEEEEDEGFSFGSVLKLLLSDSYDTTTAAPQKKKPVTTTKAPPTRIPPTPKASLPGMSPIPNKMTPPPTRLPPTSNSRTTTSKVTTTPPPTTPIEPPKPAVAPFVPMPHHYPYPYPPPKKTFQQNTVNRIDHLVLGEATAIRKPTPRPLPFKPVSPKLTTQKPKTTTRKEIQTSPERAPANVLPGVGGLKLAGCNIYGRMYRVGRIIAELSTPCQECRCTELGVQCRPLAC